MTVDAQVRASIEELNARFAWSLDLQRWDDLREVFTPDARYLSRGVELLGVDDIVSSFAARTGTRTTRHSGANLLLTPVDETTVSGRSCWVTYAHNSAPPVPSMPAYLVADFFDSYVFVARRWLISERTIVPVFRDASLAPT